MQGTGRRYGGTHGASEFSFFRKFLDGIEWYGYGYGYGTAATTSRSYEMKKRGNVAALIKVMLIYPRLRGYTCLFLVVVVVVVIVKGQSKVNA